MNDNNMNQALRACERQGIKSIMTMQYHWDDEVIAQFYATLWIKCVDEEADGRDVFLSLGELAQSELPKVC